MTQRDDTTRCRAKGLWTGRRWGTCHPSRLCAGTQGVPQTLASLSGYKPEVRLLRVKRPVERSGLKPYWGKPAVRNFRGGAGNVRHGLMPICHDAPKGGSHRKALAYTSARLLSTRHPLFRRGSKQGYTLGGQRSVLWCHISGPMRKLRTTTAVRLPREV